MSGTGRSRTKICDAWWSRVYIHGMLDLSTISYTQTKFWVKMATLPRVWMVSFLLTFPPVFLSQIACVAMTSNLPRCRGQCQNAEFVIRMSIKLVSSGVTPCVLGMLQLPDFLLRGSIRSQLQRVAHHAQQVSHTTYGTHTNQNRHLMACMEG